MKKTARQYLERAREILSDPSSWTQNNYAESKVDGRPVDVWGSNPKECSYCLAGALIIASEITYKDPPVGEQARALDAVRDLTQARGFAGITSFNDEFGRHHSEVLAVIDEAISKLPAETPVVE
jgi:hypothetical protein